MWLTSLQLHDLTSPLLTLQVMHAGVPHSAPPMHAVMDQVPGHHAYKMEPGPHDTLAHGQGPLPPGMEHGQVLGHGQGPPPPGMEHAAPAPLGMEHGQILGHGQGPLPPGMEHAMHGPPGIEHAAHAPPGMEHAAQAQYHHQMQGEPTSQLASAETAEGVWFCKQSASRSACQLLSWLPTWTCLQSRLAVALPWQLSAQL